MSKSHKYILTSPNGETRLLEIVYTTSFARDSYGWNRCTLKVDGVRKSACVGGGYDMKGTALGDWMQDEMGEDLKRVKAYNHGIDNRQGFSGLCFCRIDAEAPGRMLYATDWRDGYKVLLDGGYGFERMISILEYLGYNVKSV